MPENEVPSNGVLLAKLESMSAVVLANQITNHEAQKTIIEQTTRTNGRVTALEKAKNMGIGFLILLNLVGAFGAPYIFSFLNGIAKDHAEIKTEIIKLEK